MKHRPYKDTRSIALRQSGPQHRSITGVTKPRKFLPIERMPWAAFAQVSSSSPRGMGCFSFGFGAPGCLSWARCPESFPGNDDADSWILLFCCALRGNCGLGYFGRFGDAPLQILS
jgi:hypothetical protein